MPLPHPLLHGLSDAQANFDAADQRMASLAASDASAAQSITALQTADTAQLAVWREVLHEHCVLPGGTGATTGSPASGSLLGIGGTTGAPVAWDYVAADYAIAGKTTRLRLYVLLETNATACGIDLTFDLRPITASGGGAGVLALTTGGAVSGSSMTFTTPAASALRRSAVEFTAPADGAYLIIMTTSGTSAANSRVGVNCRLEMRHV